MTGHPVHLPRSSQYRRFALASHQGEVVVFRGPTPESMAVPSMGGPSLFYFHPFALAFPPLSGVTNVSYCFGPAHPHVYVVHI